MNTPDSLEYATSDELFAEIARRSDCAWLVRIPSHAHPTEEKRSTVVTRLHGDPLLAYDLIKRAAERPSLIRSSSR